MSRRSQSLIGLFVFLQILGPVPLTAVSAGDPRAYIARLLRRETDKPVRPDTPSDECLEQLGRNIDWLEREIDHWGTITAKSPDIWGEARLTKYRREFEEVLAQELRSFDKDRIQGGQFVKDFAFMSAALASRGVAPTGNANNLPTVAITTESQSSSSSTTVGLARPTAQTTVFGNVDLTNSNLDNITSEFKLEQTQVVDQIANYVNHLHQVRRNNDGDDTADSPGYAANLVRIPVSVIPGARSKDGFGAEITVTAEPYLGPELLPVAFRDLVINDLVDQLAIPLTRFLNGDVHRRHAALNTFHEWAEDPLKNRRLLDNINARLSRFTQLQPANDAYVFLRLIDGEVYWTGNLLTFQSVEILNNEIAEISAEHQLADEAIQRYEAKIKSINKVAIDQKTSIQSLESSYQGSTEVLNSIALIKPYFNSTEPLFKQVSELRTDKKQLDETLELVANLRDLTGKLADVKAGFSQVQITGSTRKSTLPFPPTQLESVFGLDSLGYLADFAFRSFESDILNRSVVHVSDVRSFLREEISAAYLALATGQTNSVWQFLSVNETSFTEAIRINRPERLGVLKAGFHDLYLPDHRQSPYARSLVEALSWCVLVESALLNERLNRDIRETVGNRPNAYLDDIRHSFYGPSPSIEAREAFAEYVKVRWPIRVFALDPVVNEQNISDVSSTKRQMQMAVALAYAAGDVGTTAALSAMRELQRDRATVDLKRMTVGFGHGNDTFGWRFYPRFQTAPVESNLGAFVRDMVVGGPTDRALERKEQIEPGMRECTAVVIMPSFVPHVTFHTRSNWFGLANPQHSGVSMSETLEFSRVVQNSKRLAQDCIACAHVYRDGEVDRVLARIKQLDRELPTQTMQAQVPIENTLGGFEIFSSGTRELAPELLGWYGAPGYNTGQGCQLFLSGDNFSVHETRLIVGNREIPYRLLSKQIMEVSLPAGLPFVDDPGLLQRQPANYEGYLDAHLATPYGVSGHLLIPVVRRKVDSGPSVPTMVGRTEQLTFQTAGAPKTLTANSLKHPSPTQWVQIQVPSGVGADHATRIIELHLKRGGDNLRSITLPATNLAADRSGYTVDYNVLTNQLKTSTANTLGESVKHYVDYLLANNLPTSELRLILSATLKGASGQPDVPCRGDIELILKHVATPTVAP